MSALRSQPAERTRSRAAWDIALSLAAHPHRAITRAGAFAARLRPFTLHAARKAEDPARGLPWRAGLADAPTFLAQLGREVQTHVAVNHAFLARLSHVPFTRDDYRVFGLQHYALVGTFTTYLEHLLLRAPDSDAKSWIAKVLVDEYGEGSEGKDHAELYREFLRATGAPEGEEYATHLHPAVTGFITEHLRIVREEPFLVGLGAVGPGHEWAIPRMFGHIIRGLSRAGFTPGEMSYFTLHVGQDVDHGAWLEQALERYAARPESQAEIRRGALLSLQARRKFWEGVQDKIVRWRQPENVHLRSQSHRQQRDGLGELTLEAFKAKIQRAGVVAGTHT